MQQTYLDLDQQCQQFAIDLIAECRSSVEVSTVLSGRTTKLDEDMDEASDEEDDILPLLKVAMSLNQKKVSSHPYTMDKYERVEPRVLYNTYNTKRYLNSKELTISIRYNPFTVSQLSGKDSKFLTF